MTLKEMLVLEKLENDDQLDQAIAYLDEFLRKLPLHPDENALNNPDFMKLTDLVEEFENRTDVLNRDFRI